MTIFIFIQSFSSLQKQLFTIITTANCCNFLFRIFGRYVGRRFIRSRVLVPFHLANRLEGADLSPRPSSDTPIVRVSINQRCETRANVSVSWEYIDSVIIVYRYFSLFPSLCLFLSLSRKAVLRACVRLNCAPDKRAVRESSMRGPRDISLPYHASTTRTRTCTYTRAHVDTESIIAFETSFIRHRWRNPRD